MALLVGIQGQKHKPRRGGSGEAASTDTSGAVAAPAAATAGPPDPANITSANFNTTDKTQYSRREWMEIAITRFFDDFEDGITVNAPYIFAEGAPYISNGALYAGLNMADAATWDVIPRKTRSEREFSPLNGTETWVRCLGTYPDGHQAIEFTSYTFDRKGMITSMSKIENKECTAAADTTPPASSPTTAATPPAAVMYPGSPVNTSVATPPAAGKLRADTKTASPPDAAASAPTSGKAKGRGKK